MWAEVNGERKKVACGPCIRGHRSSKCDHRDRVLVEVRKPGRPLSSCPHPTGSCSCERVVINYTIPKTSECACPSEQAQTVASSTASGRVQKQRLRKSVTTFNAAGLERAIKANQDGETDSSSLLTRTPTSDSNSPPSSASSTPRLLPSRKASQGAADFSFPASSMAGALPAATQPVSSCCQPKPVQQAPPPQRSCCSTKAQEAPKPVAPVKSCCGGAKAPPQPQPQFTPQDGSMNRNMNGFSFPQYPAAFQSPPYNMLNQNNHFVPMAPPFNFHTPIYNHVGAMFHPQQPPAIPMSPMVGNHTGSQTPAMDHNCHCGDSCSCFGCAAHPNNATMMEYIRSMHQYMSTGQFTSGLPPTYDLPAYPHQAYAAPHYINPHHPMSFPSNTPLGMPSTPLNAPSPWTTATPTPGPVSTPLQTPLSLETHYFPPTTSMPSTTATPTTAPKNEPALQSPTFAASNSPLAITTENPDKDTSSSPDDSANGPTLSPSSYFWNEVVLPGCNDATGTCQCGDGCECVGCLTHGGHNGVALELGDVGAGDGAGGEQRADEGFADGGAGEFERFVSGQGGEEAFLGFG